MDKNICCCKVDRLIHQPETITGFLPRVILYIVTGQWTASNFQSWTTDGANQICMYIDRKQPPHVCWPDSQDFDVFWPEVWYALRETAIISSLKIRVVYFTSGEIPARCAHKYMVCTGVMQKTFVVPMLQQLLQLICHVSPSCANTNIRPNFRREPDLYQPTASGAHSLRSHRANHTKLHVAFSTTDQDSQR